MPQEKETKTISEVDVLQDRVVHLERQVADLEAGFAMQATGGERLWRGEKEAEGLSAEFLVALLLTPPMALPGGRGVLLEVLLEGFLEQCPVGQLRGHLGAFRRGLGGGVRTFFCLGRGFGHG